MVSLCSGDWWEKWDVGAPHEPGIDIGIFGPLVGSYFNHKGGT